MYRRATSVEASLSDAGNGCARDQLVHRVLLAHTRVSTGPSGTLVMAAVASSLCLGQPALSAPPLVDAPAYFQDDTIALDCGNWVTADLMLVPEEVTCPCLRYTPDGTSCESLPTAIIGVSNCLVGEDTLAAADRTYMRLRRQRCEELWTTLAEDSSANSRTPGAYILKASSGVYQQAIPECRFVGVMYGLPILFWVFPCQPDMHGDSEEQHGICHVRAKLRREVYYFPPPSGEPDDFQRQMQIRASATIKLEGELNRLGCPLTGSATASGQSEVRLTQNLATLDIGIGRKFPSSIGGERVFDFSGATSTTTSGFTLKVGEDGLEVEVGFTGSTTSPADGDFRVIAKSEKIDWESDSFCMWPPHVPEGHPYVPYTVELHGEAVSRALLATGRWAECVTEVHLHSLEVSYENGCMQCFAVGGPMGPGSHNP